MKHSLTDWQTMFRGQKKPIHIAVNVSYVKVVLSKKGVLPFFQIKLPLVGKNGSIVYPMSQCANFS